MATGRLRPARPSRGRRWEARPAPGTRTPGTGGRRGAAARGREPQRRRADRRPRPVRRVVGLRRGVRGRRRARSWSDRRAVGRDSGSSPPASLLGPDQPLGGGAGASCSASRSSSSADGGGAGRRTPRAGAPRAASPRGRPTRVSSSASSDGSKALSSHSWPCSRHAGPVSPGADHWVSAAVLVAAPVEHGGHLAGGGVGPVGHVGDDAPWPPTAAGHLGARLEGVAAVATRRRRAARPPRGGPRLGPATWRRPRRSDGEDVPNDRDAGRSPRGHGARRPATRPRQDASPCADARLARTTPGRLGADDPHALGDGVASVLRRPARIRLDRPRRLPAGRAPRAGASDLEELLLLVGQELVDGRHHLLGQLVELLLDPLELVGGEVAVVLERFELVAGRRGAGCGRPPGPPPPCAGPPSPAPCAAPR